MTYVAVPHLAGEVFLAER